MRQPDSLTLFAPDVDSMRSIGIAFAETLKRIESPFVVALEGELGAGKTTLVGAVLNHLGVAGSAKSPTYTLIESYAIQSGEIYHMDLYRLADPSEVDALGLRDLLVANSIFLIEWPERGTGRLPPTDMEVRIEYSQPAGRSLTFRSFTKPGLAVLLALTAAEKP